MDRRGETGPAAKFGCGDDEESQENNTTHQQHELDNANPCAGLEAAGADVEPDDKGHKDTAERHRYAGNDVEQGR